MDGPYPSPTFECRIYLKVEDAEGHEGHDAGDDQLGQVVVVEDVVLQVDVNFINQLCGNCAKLMVEFWSYIC